MLARINSSKRPTAATLSGIIIGLATLWLGVGATAEDQQPTAQLALSTPTETEALDLSPLDVHPRISLTIVEQLRLAHYLKKDLDDQVSSQIFENYLEMLDGAKVYFTGADMAELEKYRYKLDDALVPGTPIGEALALDDTLMELELTPNRGDCLYLEGIARDVAAINGAPVELMQFTGSRTK